MEENNYPFSFRQSSFRYEFLSVSEEKTIKKVVEITQITASASFYNLALLDELEDGSLSDITESNNKDLVTVMATVFKIVDDFLLKNDCYIVFRGSDKKRQRLYRIIISKELERIKKRFAIYGQKDDIISDFEANKDYDYFLITRK